MHEWRRLCAVAVLSQFFRGLQGDAGQEITVLTVGLPSKLRGNLRIRQVLCFGCDSGSIPTQCKARMSRTGFETIPCCAVSNRQVTPLV